MRCKTCDYPLWNLVWIGSASYAVTPTTFGQLPSLLQQQNQHRATLGLPPLPDLTTVTHGNRRSRRRRIKGGRLWRAPPRGP